MPERPSERNAAVLVGLDFGVGGYADGVEELRRLAVSAGIHPRALVRGRRHRPDPAHFAGSGKVEEIKRMLQEQRASLAVFNHDLSPVQERNLEKALGCPVVDRTRLILDIFAQRANSHEGKLQVEEVNKVLVEIGASAIPQVLAWNKIDRNGARPGVDRDEYAKIRRVRLSAKTGDGVDGLRQALIEAAASRTSPANPPNSTYSQIPGQEAAS